MLFLISRDTRSTNRCLKGVFRTQTNTPVTVLVRSRCWRSFSSVFTLQRGQRDFSLPTDVVAVTRQNHANKRAVKHKKMVAEAPKPPAAVPSLKHAPGMYKGKIIQSKITSIWKSSSSVGEADPKPSAPKTESQKAGNMTKMESKSAADTLRNGAQKPAPTRAKLANWLASKGKTFKRPAMTTAVQQKTKFSTKPSSGPKPQTQSHAETQSVKQNYPEPEHVQEAENPDPAAAHCADTQRAEVTTHCQTPAVVNTTLNLLEDSDDLCEGQQDRVDDIVVDLCDALEAMEMPSRCNDEVLQGTDLCAEVEKADSAKGGMETTPPREGASVVKYSVKTTPYLQSVKKIIEGAAGSSSSRKKNNIHDLKFVTPVRRSLRIQRKLSRMPTIIRGHDPCMSSLAELEKLGDDPTAYIYRKNLAMLAGLPASSLRSWDTISF
ncbi:cytoskeleton-associated protein 2-like [Cheilinus undulatus]|uniref:cytoskeleton-associated protein 2-like n=1 Tax=Cheilinus undulatus TaxID=241271 RepID=UPI001BD3A941|nr:cytoskeleton-associated protein 2-like [Cheilinus undulatus]